VYNQPWHLSCPQGKKTSFLTNALEAQKQGSAKKKQAPRAKSTKLEGQPQKTK